MSMLRVDSALLSRKSSYTPSKVASLRQTEEQQGFKNLEGLKARQVQIQILQDGDYFGEIGLICNLSRTASVLSK
jgi:CRP-like cAMP-binding protein